MIKNPMLCRAFESFLEKMERLKKEYYQDIEMIEAKYKNPKLNCKLGGIDDSIAAGFKTRPLKKVAQVDIYDRNWEAVDDEFANLVKK